MIPHQNVSWSEIDSMIDSIYDQLLKLPQKFSSITTVSRGGLVPSRLLADRLDIKKIRVDETEISPNSLIVDDIFDSGSTFKRIISKPSCPSDVVFVTLFARSGKKYPKQLYYARKTDSNAYVVFPWDKFEFNRLN
ncbi:MAG: phosphoribosyltransferase [Nitrosopumilus sp.]